VRCWRDGKEAWLSYDDIIRGMTAIESAQIRAHVSGIVELSIPSEASDA
jgi:hypothetical protein